jgi:hypothetical protein
MCRYYYSINIKTLIRVILIPLYFILTLGHSLAQERDSIRNSKKRLDQNLDSLRFASVNKKNLKFTPFIAPSYSPELQVLVSAGGLLTFSLQKENPLLDRSSIPFSIGYSSNGSLTGNIKTNFYGREDKWRLVGDIWIKDMPDHYWGVGHELGVNVPQSDSTTAYNRSWLKFIGRLGFRVKENFYIGPILDLNRTEATNINPRMQNDPDFLATGPLSRNSGLGILIQYDSRDFAVNAYRGIYLDLDYILYGDFLGGKNNFNVMEMDYRQYLEIKRRKTLAWELRSRWATGDSPWTEKSLLGSPWDLRGYFWGRYRDNYMHFILVEYRHMFHRNKPNKKGSKDSRSGFVVWSGQGAISPEWNRDFSWIPNFGIGYRFEVQSRMNFRIDYGIGEDSSAIYFSFNEAF